MTRALAIALAACVALLPGCGGNPPAPPRPTPAPTPAPTSPGSADPRYADCDEARRHGAGPYTTADPEYRWYRDTDGDGVACERDR